MSDVRLALEGVDIGERGEIDGVAPGEVGVGVLEQAVGSLPQLGDLVVGQRLPAFQRLRAFERCRAAVQPDALQIGMSVRAGRLSGNGRVPARDNGCESCQHSERSTVHLNLRLASRNNSGDSMSERVRKSA